MSKSDGYYYNVNLNVFVLIKMLSNDTGYQGPHISYKSETYPVIYHVITYIPLDFYIFNVSIQVLQVCLGLEVGNEIMQFFYIIKAVFIKRRSAWHCL